MEFDLEVSLNLSDSFVIIGESCFISPCTYVFRCKAILEHDAFFFYIPAKEESTTKYTALTLFTCDHNRQKEKKLS